MSFINYPNAVTSAFEFLVNDYGFKLVENRTELYGWFMSYKKQEPQRGIYLQYEFREERFKYILNDGKSEMLFWDYFHRFDPTIFWYSEGLVPVGNAVVPAVEKNAALLKKYGHAFLSGKEDLV